MDKKLKQYLLNPFVFDKLGRVVIKDNKTLDIINAAAGPVPTNYLDIYCNNQQDLLYIHKNLNCTDNSCKFPNSSCSNPCGNAGCL